MNCCEKKITEFIILEALLMRSQCAGTQFATDMIERAGISRGNPDDMEIIEKIGDSAKEMFTDLFG